MSDNGRTIARYLICPGCGANLQWAYVEPEVARAIAELEDAYDRVCDERDNARDMAIALMEIVVQCDVELEAESLTRLHPDG